MAKTRRQLSLLALAIAVALAIVPKVALGEEWDEWYDDSSYEDSWYEEYSYTEVESWYADDDSSEYYESYEEDTWYDESYSYEGDDYYEEDYSYDESYDDSYGYEDDYDDTYYVAPSYSYAGWGSTGVDVSEWNGTIDWERVQASGISYAILKCGGADDWNGYYQDSEFVRNALECERLGIPYGVYFYSTASSSWEAASEAYFVLSIISGFNPSLPIFLDMENEWMGDWAYVDQINDVAVTFCSCVESYGYAPGVYASASWWEWFLTDPALDWWCKWVAQYDGYCEYEGCQFWQCSRWGEVDGIDWPVDINVCYW